VSKQFWFDYNDLCDWKKD